MTLALLGAPELPAQHPSELTVRDKTQLFIQHVVKFMKVDPSKYQAMVLEYEIGAAIAESTEDHEHEKGCIHDRVSHLSRNFIDNALVELHPEYGAAKALYDAGKTAETAAALDPLLRHLDPYVAGHARLLAAELAFQAGDHARVLAHCDEVIAKFRGRVARDHRASELIALTFEKEGKPLLGLAQYAILLTDYEELPKDVEQRAKERLMALQQETGEPLETVASWMNAVEKALAGEVTGEPTQAKEREIVTALDKLIELEEARERKACSGCGGNCKGNKCGNGRGVGKPSAPRERSLLPQGEGKLNLTGVSRANADSIWGQLRMQDASRALQAFSGKLPARYEKLLEQYYKDLAREN
jgi:hypothetical protein